MAIGDQRSAKAEATGGVPIARHLPLANALFRHSLLACCSPFAGR
jgi:hypothetical protein